jgi:chemotaxis protein methyltransferase CheR
MTAPRLVLDDEQLGRLRQLLSRTAGLAFDGSRRESLSYSIAERLRATGIGTVGAYLEEVEAAGSTERQRLIDEVTIQETHFFRNPPQMRALRRHVLPELLRHAGTSGGRLRIWSAGCSTGEEPYTVAMMLRELLPSTAGWDVKVLATDISEHALTVAREATYGARAVQLATPDEADRFFTPLPDGRFQVRPEVRELVELAHHNLVLDEPPAQTLDLVLCRNVTIYFGRDTTRALMGRLHAALRDGGYLFLGHSETLWQVSEDFRLVSLGSGGSAAFVYRRLDEPAGERRAVLPDRRTLQELPIPAEQRVGPRRGLHRPRADRPRHAVHEPAAPPGEPLPPDPLEAVRAALTEGRYADAARLARLAADVVPLQAEVHYLHGRALVDQGLHGDALPPLRRAVYLDPDAGLAHFLLAGALARCGDAAAAAREYRAAAQALTRHAVDPAAPELGGRSPRELAALCAQLEGQLTAGSGR